MLPPLFRFQGWLGNPSPPFLFQFAISPRLLTRTYDKMAEDWILPADWQPPSLPGINLIHIYELPILNGPIDESRPSSNEDGEYNIDWIGALGVNHDAENRGGIVVVCVKWQGWPVEDATWKSIEDIPATLLPESEERMRHRIAASMRCVTAGLKDNKQAYPVQKHEEEEDDDDEVFVEEFI